MTRSIRPLAFLPRIIGGLALLVLAGCSAVRFGYDNAPSITYWWLDSFVDFSTVQSPSVRESLSALHAWHRQHELPAYADTLRKLRQLARTDVTPAQLCGAWTEVQTHLQHLGEGAVGGLSAFTPTASPQQLQHLALQFDKRNEKWRDEWLDISPEELAKRRLKQATNRAEMLYDRLDEPQMAILRESIARSSYDAHLVYREILRRQQDILQVLEEHSVSGGARSAHVQAEVLALLERLRRSPDPVYRALQDKMTLEGCASLAALHNSTNPAQRATLQQILGDYEADARALALEK